MPKPLTIETLSPRDLCLPIYLNKQAVLDILAVLEDGFSHTSTIKSTSTETTASAGNVRAGMNADLGFIALNIGAGGKKSKGGAEEHESSTERIHTPASLFAKMRLRLRDSGLLHMPSTSSEILSLSPGDFVELDVAFQKNTLREFFVSILGLFELILAMQGPVGPGDNPEKRKQKEEKHKYEQIAAQVRSVIADFDKAGIELTGTMSVANGISIVLPVQSEGFVGKSMGDVMGGELRVLGKIVHIIDDKNETLNLLRRTSFGLLSQELLDNVTSIASVGRGAGLNLSDVKTIVNGPVANLIPIAIYV